MKIQSPSLPAPAVESSNGGILVPFGLESTRTMENAGKRTLMVTGGARKAMGPITAGESIILSAISTLRPMGTDRGPTKTHRAIRNHVSKRKADRET